MVRQASGSQPALLFTMSRPLRAGVPAEFEQLLGS